MGNFGGDVTGIAFALISAAFAALLIGHPAGTVAVTNAVGGNFNNLLNTIELNGQGSNFSLTSTPGL